MKADTRLIRFGDVAVIAAFALLCAALFMLPFQHRDASLSAQVVLDGDVVETIALSSLSEEQTMDVGGCTIVFSPNGVRFTDADCPDRLCVKTGVIRFAGESIACVPNRVVVSLQASTAQNEPYDVVAY